MDKKDLLAREMTESGKVNISGHSLSWETWGKKTYYRWYGKPVCTVEHQGGSYHLAPDKDMEGVKEGQHEFVTFGQAHESVLGMFKEHKDVIKKLESLSKAEKEAGRRERNAEQAKSYHLELSELTPEHDLLHADILTVRSLTILKHAGISTLRELSHWQRRDFANLRNCGKGTVDEMEALLTQVGLTWGMKDSQYVGSVTLSALIEKLQEIQRTHPEYAERAVYFDGLHINGGISVLDDTALELS